MDPKGQWRTWLRWFLTRTGIVYLAIILGIAVFLNPGSIWSNAEIRALNRLMPLFDNLAGVAVDHRTLTAAQWEDYIAYYDQVRQLMPEEAGAYFFLGFCKARSMKNARGVAKYFRKAVKEAPGIFWFDYNLGIALYNQGQYTEAVEYLQNATLDHVPVMELYMAKSVLFRQVLVSAAKMGYDSESSFLSALSNAYLVAAKSLYLMGKENDALKVLHEAFSKHLNQDKDFYRLASMVLIKEKRLAEAVATLRSGLSKFPVDIDLLQEFQQLLKTTGSYRDELRKVSIMINLAKARGIKAQDLFHKEKQRLF